MSAQGVRPVGITNPVARVAIQQHVLSGIPRSQSSASTVTPPGNISTQTLPPGQSNQSSAGETSPTSTVSTTRQAYSPTRQRQDIVTTTAPSSQKPFWSVTLPSIANVCGVLGLCLALTLGVTQWLAQDKSNAIARESELVTLALSCSDEQVKHIPVCQQFLSKHPDGPVITRRGNNSLSSQRSSKEEGLPSLSSTRVIALEGAAVHLATMDRFLREQGSRLQSVLEPGDPRLLIAQVEDMVRVEKAFLQNIASIKTTLARYQKDATAASDHTILKILSQALKIMTVAFVVTCVGLLLNHEFGHFLLLGLYICIIDPIIVWVWLRMEWWANWISGIFI